MEKLEEKKTSQGIANDDLEKLSPGDFFCEAIISFNNPEDENETLTGTFKVYDGIAFGDVKTGDEEREIVATFPLAKFINKTAKTTMKKRIMDALEITEDRDLTPVEILQAYNTFKFVDSYLI